MDINAERVIEANNMYAKISKIITSYRKTRRNETKSEFSEFLGISHPKFLDTINEYLFVNTGDIILLNAVKLLKNKYKEKNIDFDDNKLIRDSIFLIHKQICDNHPDGVRNVSALTKNTKLFKEIKQVIETL